jgi:hypothetical protein
MTDEMPKWPQKPAEFFRLRAAMYRRMAEDLNDPNLVDQYRRLADAFDEEAQKAEGA